MIAFILKLLRDMGEFKTDSISFHLNLSHVIISVFCPGDSEASRSSVKKNNYTLEYPLQAFMWLLMLRGLTSNPTQAVERKMAE